MLWDALGLALFAGNAYAGIKGNALNAFIAGVLLVVLILKIPAYI
jgi:tetrahydromethanopterin S-methyltransferase subunit F